MYYADPSGRCTGCSSSANSGPATRPPKAPGWLCRCCVNLSAWELFSRTGVDPDGGGNQEQEEGGNAMQHCLLSCMSAVQCGQECALDYWDSRETNPAAVTHQMDLQNNLDGRDCAARYDSGSHGAPVYFCYDCCMQKLEAGELTCLSGKPRTTVPCPKPDPDEDPVFPPPDPVPPPTQ